ncbi:MAG: hypothetical protein ACRC33_08660 [Gemmataceae bacterium]
MTPPPDRTAIALLIVTAVGLALGRIGGSEYLYEPSVHRPDDKPKMPRPKWASPKPEGQPTYGSNDRSRWAAIRALTERGTFVIGTRGKWDDPATDAGIVFEPGFQTVDKVLHPERLEYYSTKPPLLTVMAAGQCWVLQQLFGWRVAEDRWLVVRSVLITFNLLPFALYLWLVADAVRRLGAGAFTAYYAVAAAAFAGMAWPFLVTFNNHVPATAAAALALWAAVRVSLEDDAPAWLYAAAGLASGFAFALELPALSLLAALAAYLLWRSPGRALTLFLPLALLAPAAQAAIDYVQLGQVTPTYAQFGTPWYAYPGSHWLPEGETKPGIDYARRNGETRAAYAYHLLIGHHGWFSLMPVWLLSLAGMAAMRPRDADRVRRTRGMVALLAALVSVAVIGFYLSKSDNYGGWCNGPRWLMWLSPLWLLCLVPALDALSRPGRWLACGLLIASMASMNYQSWNPWRHPWIYNLMEWRGWPGY